MAQPRITPSLWYLALAGAVCVAGWALFGVILFARLGTIEKDLQQVLAPGQTNIVLQKPGDYTIFYEYRSVFNGRVYSTDESISGLECIVTSRQTGSRIPLSPSRMNSTYEIEARAGRSIFDFNIQQPGTYTLTSSYPEGQAGPQIVLAAGKNITAYIFLIVGECLASVFGSLGIAVAIAVITLVKREKCKKRLAQSAPIS